MNLKQIFYKKKFIINLLAVLVLISSTLPLNVRAIDLDFFSSNDILFYTPGETGCVGDPNDQGTPPAGNDNQEKTANFLVSTAFSGNSDKPMNAVQMAALMGNIQQESGFNPNAGEGRSYRGIVQWSSPGRWDNVADPKTDLINQLNYLKKELDGTYKNSLDEFWNAATIDDLDKATYAITRNYEVAILNGGGSKTWTNNTDAANNVQDWVKRKNYAKGFYDKYGNLAESGTTPGSECGGLASGGMTLEKAKSFMTEYKNLEPKDWPAGTPGTIYGINGTNCSGGSLANCVAFSQYFVNRYTEKKLTSPRDGRYTAGQLIALGFTDGGNVPKVYSIFSRNSGTYGHTGVVLGIDKENDKIIIGEAGCGNTLEWSDAREYSLSKFSTSEYTYAYTDNLLKDGEL